MPEHDMVMFEEDYQQINNSLQKLLNEAYAKYVLLVDRNGQLISTQGDTTRMDSIAFASLSAGNFAATSELARIIGENEFSVIFHQGVKESIHISTVEQRVILVVVFDNRTTLGLVKLKVKKAVDELSAIFSEIFAKLGRGERRETGISPEFRSVAESEIDNLFKD